MSITKVGSTVRDEDMAAECTRGVLSPEPNRRHLHYGEQQGSFMSVGACSNHHDGFFSGESNYVNHIIYTGFRYQCVEYARRFLLLTTGCVFGNCGRALEIFAMRHITHVETGEQFPLVAHNNGASTRRPSPGDIIVYPYHPEHTPWGHVGIISYVDDSKVGVAEQNQMFTSFFSPRPDYLNGEKCVARYIDLQHDAADGTWRLDEESTFLSCLGWMSYPDAPRRTVIHAPLKPLPELMHKRSSPIDAEGHPAVWRYTLPQPVGAGVVSVSDIFGMKGAAGEAMVGAVTATTRVLRFTLQLLFDRRHLTPGFLALPGNPFDAPISADTPSLGKLFHSIVETLGDKAGNEEKLLPCLAEYFEIPEKWLAAMQREFSKGEMLMCSGVTFCLNMSNAESQIKELRDNRIQVLLPDEVHDESWCLCSVDGTTPRILAELSVISSLAGELSAYLSKEEPQYRNMLRSEFRIDFGRYLLEVGERRGRRTEFTIVTTPMMDDLQTELVRMLQMYCADLPCASHVVTEQDLYYDKNSGMLRTKPVATVTGQAATPSPSGGVALEVNFVFCLSEWADILYHPEDHMALYEAALDPRSDVVFAKPLWSYLCSGLANRLSDEQSVLPVSVKLFDISRRLHQLSLPSQPAESWDQAVSEYKGSCRRIHLSGLIRKEPPAQVTVTAALINMAMSAASANVERQMEGAVLHNGRPAALMHMFMIS